MVYPWVGALWALQLADHAGILLLIAGTYTPFLLRLCYLKLLGFVWGVGVVSFVAKATRSRLDVIPLHVGCFLLMGWTITPYLTTVYSAFSPATAYTIFGGGCVYTVGLWPWASNKLELHNAIWHAFVLLASGLFFSVVYNEVARPETWPQWADPAASDACAAY